MRGILHNGASKCLTIDVKRFSMREYVASYSVSKKISCLFIVQYIFATI